MDKDITECLISYFINQFCFKKFEEEDKFNIRLIIWILYQFLLLLFWFIFAIKGFRSIQDDGYPLILFCCLSTYYIQSCEEKYIFYGINNLSKRKKKLKIIDLIQNILVIALLLIKRFLQEDNSIGNIVSLICFGIDTFMNLVELVQLFRKKGKQKSFSAGGTKSIYLGSLFGLIPTIILWIIYFPPNELFKFQSYNAILYVYLFSLLFIFLTLCLRMYQNKEGKYNPLTIKRSKLFLLFFYGITQGFYQLTIAPLNLVYQIIKFIFCKRHESVSQSAPIKTLEN